MKLEKHQRLAVRALQKRYPAMQIHMHPARKHPKLVAHFAGHRIQVTVSSSPSCDEDVVRNCVREVAARFKALGVRPVPFESP